MKNGNQNKLSLAAAAILTSFFVWVNFAQAAASDIVFTEIMYDAAGSDTDKEWVEIYNSGSSPVTIVDGSGAGSWRFNDGSNHLLALTQGSLIVAAGGVAIIAGAGAQFLADHPGFSGTVIDTVMTLNNTTDAIKLSADSGGSFFNEVTYQNSWGGAGDGKTIEKINPASGNEQSNWQSSSADGGTPGTVTIQSQETPTSTPPISTPATSGTNSSPPPPAPQKVKISEILPNPDKDQKEFVELVNNNYSPITLEGWKLADGKKVVVLPTVTLVASEYRAFFGDDTKIVLNNEGDVISLYDKDGELMNKLSYGATVKGQALAYNQAQDKFVWSAKPTPNAANEITKTNEPPVARITLSNNPVAPDEEIIISASESSDPDDDALTFLWSLADGWQASGMNFSYRFKETGPRLITLAVNDGRLNAMAAATVNVLPANEVVALRSQKTAAKTSPLVNPQDAVVAASTTTPATASQIFINEIFPNPAGRDDDEWIELFNPNDKAVSLAGWLLDDSEGGSSPYKFANQIIAPLSYLIIKKKDSRLLLNNTTDEARLFSPEQKLIDRVPYKDALENESYNKDDDEEWSWTKNTTPGKPNTIEGIVSSANANSNPPPIPSSPFTSPYVPSDNIPSEILDIDLANIRELSLGSLVKVQGTVAVEPGVLAKTYFYITGSPGIQVYFSQRDWPKLALGDVVGVIGTLSEVSGETRLRVADKGDIIPLYKSQPPQAEEIETGDIGDNTEGWLVKITGELVKKQGASWHLDDGSGEVRVVFQNGTKIKKPEAKAGDWLEVIGLVSETRSGYRLLPRYQNDVKLVDAAKLNEIQGKVLGATTATADDNIQRFRIPANDKPRKILVYLLITSGALIILLVGLLVKLRIETTKRIKELKTKQ